MVVGPLRALLLAALAERDVEVALPVEHEARAEMLAAAPLWALPEEGLDVLQPVAGEPTARHFGAHAVRPAGGVGNVDHAVLRELRMQHHIHQPALPVHRDFRQPGDRLRVELVVRDQAQPPGFLRDEHASVRKEGERPGLLQTAHEFHYAKRMLLGLDGLGYGKLHGERAGQQHKDGFHELIMAEDRRRFRHARLGRDVERDQVTAARLCAPSAEHFLQRPARRGLRRPVGVAQPERHQRNATRAEQLGKPHPYLVDLEQLADRLKAQAPRGGGEI